MNGRREAFGGMELIGRLSSGGMGEVLLARRRGAHGFEKLVAVKTIRCDLVQRDDIRRMFLDEARLMARLDHPAITQVYDFGEHNDVLFLAMEYVPGVVLNRLLKKRGERLPQSVAARIAIQVAHGLHAAHELVDADGNSLGVVHRDVSPHNLILTFDGRVKILDFGIALFRDREAPETEHGVVKGKVSYIAPEQLKGHRADRRSDIYSLGVVLHELLTGRKLFTSNTPLQDLADRETAPAPSVVVPEISPALDEIVMKALAFDPEKRFQAARDVALALERALPSIPGETVEEFAERELAEERSSQRVRLSSISSGQDKGPAPDSAVPSLAIAVESGDVLQLDPVSGVVASDSPAVRPVRDPAASLSGVSDVDLSSVPARSTGGPFVFVLLLAAVATLSVVLLTREPEDGDAPTVEDRTRVEPRDRRFAAEPAPRALDPRAAPESKVRPGTATAAAPVEAAPLAAESPKVAVAAASGAEALGAAPDAGSGLGSKPELPAATPEEAPKAEAKAEPKAEASKAEAKVEPKAEAKVQPKAEAKQEARAEVKAKARPSFPDTPPIPPAPTTPTTPPIAPSAAVSPLGATPKVAAPRAPTPVKAPAPKVDTKKKPVATPKVREPASLTVEASPNAVVMIDGKVVGFTPISVKLEPGKHELQVRKPYSRALRWKRTLWLREGQKLELTAPPE